MINKKRLSAIFLSLIITTSTSTISIGQTNCPQFYAGGQAPILINAKLVTKYRELCNGGFANGHSGLTRGPLWGAELLTKQDIDEGRGVARHDNFRPDTRLPASERSELRDYAQSGYDRGHVVNNRDLAPEKRDESFFLSNILPHAPENNRGIWSAIESAARYEAKKRGQIYVMTGPFFQGQQVQALKGRVLIPTGLYKCLYDATRQQAGCYTVANTDDAHQYQVASVAEVEQSAGINLFPAMPVQVKEQLMKLPVPKVRR